MPKTWGCVDIRDTFYNVGCRANPCDIEPVNASVLPTMPKSLKARTRMARQRHAARVVVFMVITSYGDLAKKMKEGENILGLVMDIELNIPAPELRVDEPK